MKTLDTCKYHVSNGVLTLSNALFSHSIQGVDRAVASVKDAGGLSVPYLEVCALSGDEEKTYCIWEDLCAVYMPRFSGGNILTLGGEHWVVSYITLKAFSDSNDTLLEKSELHLYLRSLPQKEGDIFILEDKESGNCIVILSETPDYLRATLEIRYGQVNVENGGNGLMLGFCRTGEGEKLCRDYYRRARHCRGLLAMSNTWGDRNGFSRVCRDFVRNEIDTARELGVGIVQIDDGWQTGNSAEVQRDPLGRRIFDGDFWELDRNKFPDGMEEITQYARNAGIKVGLWFAPDSHDCYALLDRDIRVLRKAYDEWGIRFFKLDMFRIQNSEERDRFLSLLSAIYSLGNDVAVQIDVTRDDRLNYLCGREYGTVFVENRYTKVGNYFPHRVLRNLWMLGHYVPTSKFQFELVNPDLNVQSYRENDPFAPSLYDMDYLFACVMLSNPLFWMEMQFLSKERRCEIENILSIWKSLRPFLANADVKPIGDKPSGRSFTGFEISDGSKVISLRLKYLFRCFASRLPALKQCVDSYKARSVKALHEYVRHIIYEKQHSRQPRPDASPKKHRQKTEHGSNRVRCFCNAGFLDQNGDFALRFQSFGGQKLWQEFWHTFAQQLGNDHTCIGQSCFPLHDPELMINLSVLFKAKAFEREFILSDPLSRQYSSKKKHYQPHT